MATETTNATTGGVEAQLASLYKEREMLEKELGMSDASDILKHVKAQEAKISKLQDELAAKSASIDPNGAAAELRLLREQFADCGKPEIVFESIDGKRTLRVLWKAAA
jgi:hypothetical protein